MNLKTATDTMIENMVGSVLSRGASDREAFLTRETLYSLARLIRSEQMLEIRTNVRKLTGGRQYVVRNQRADRWNHAAQGQLEFTQFSS